ncbi:hypothetical protein IAR55_007197 [Kwoniella newhampshirensis]|uniref:Uncharacterized protein n=1 Tax=Kwoniella newhampshirensis TaxID=1651941 RepID=A0AAW0YS21_9TREE
MHDSGTMSSGANRRSLESLAARSRPSTEGSDHDIAVSGPGPSSLSLSPRFAHHHENSAKFTDDEDGRGGHEVEDEGVRGRLEADSSQDDSVATGEVRARGSSLSPRGSTTSRRHSRVSYSPTLGDHSGDHRDARESDPTSAYDGTGDQSPTTPLVDMHAVPDRPDALEGLATSPPRIPVSTNDPITQLSSRKQASASPEIEVHPDLPSFEIDSHTLSSGMSDRILTLVTPFTAITTTMDRRKGPISPPDPSTGGTVLADPDSQPSVPKKGGDPVKRKRMEDGHHDHLAGTPPPELSVAKRSKKDPRIYLTRVTAADGLMHTLLQDLVDSIVDTTRPPGSTHFFEHSWPALPALARKILPEIEVRNPSLRRWALSAPPSRSYCQVDSRKIVHLAKSSDDIYRHDLTMWELDQAIGHTEIVNNLLSDSADGELSSKSVSAILAWMPEIRLIAGVRQCVVVPWYLSIKSLADPTFAAALGSTSPPVSLSQSHVQPMTSIPRPPYRVVGTMLLEGQSTTDGQPAWGAYKVEVQSANMRKTSIWIPREVKSCVVNVPEEIKALSCVQGSGSVKWHQPEVSALPPLSSRRTMNKSGASALRSVIVLQDLIVRGDTAHKITGISLKKEREHYALLVNRFRILGERLVAIVRENFSAGTMRDT